MPTAAPHACPSPGCPALVPAGQARCPEHTQKHESSDRDRRGSSAERGYGARWQAYRKRFLGEHPLCVQCHADGRVTAATVVDHVIDHKGDQQLFWDPSNHQALCAPHHNARVDAGDFGRPIPTPNQEKTNG